MNSKNRDHKSCLSARSFVESPYRALETTKHIAKCKTNIFATNGLLFSCKEYQFALSVYLSEYNGLHKKVLWKDG